MPLQPLELNQQPSRVQGDVTIDASAVIAPGVLLLAGPAGKIVIGAGVCIGMGAILNAYNGLIEIGDGVSLGAGVLVVGRSRIGANACIGVAATIFNVEIGEMEAIGAGAIRGDRSRQVSIENILPTAEPPLESDIWEEAPPEPTPSEPVPSEPLPPEPTPVAIESPPGTPVFGKVYVNQLLLTLFPQGQPNRRMEN